MLALILALAMSVSQEPEILQPRTYVSPSGEWRLSVDPSSKFGDGSARVAVSRGGVAAWEARLSFTFWEASVTDAGYTTGYGLTDPRGRGASDELLVAILAPDGTALLEERVERTPSQFIQFPPNPDPLGAFAQPALDRFVVRVKDPDVNAQDETWWSYRMPSGELLGRVHPKHSLEDSTGLRWAMDARPIGETPLTLVQWYHVLWGSGADRELTSTRRAMRAPCGARRAAPSRSSPWMARARSSARCASARSCRDPTRAADGAHGSGSRTTLRAPCRSAPLGTIGPRRRRRCRRARTRRRPQRERTRRRAR